MSSLSELNVSELLVLKDKVLKKMDEVNLPIKRRLLKIRLDILDKEFAERKLLDLQLMLPFVD